jgi:hypothetical protein
MYIRQQPHTHRTTLRRPPHQAAQHYFKSTKSSSHIFMSDYTPTQGAEDKGRAAESAHYLHSIPIVLTIKTTINHPINFQTSNPILPPHSRPTLHVHLTIHLRRTHHNFPPSPMGTKAECLLTYLLVGSSPAIAPTRPQPPP